MLIFPAPLPCLPPSPHRQTGSVVIHSFSFSAHCTFTVDLVNTHPHPPRPSVCPPQSTGGRGRERNSEREGTSVARPADCVGFQIRKISIYFPLKSTFRDSPHISPPTQTHIRVVPSHELWCFANYHSHRPVTRRLWIWTPEISYLSKDFHHL